jgi:hypothetical protein
MSMTAPATFDQAIVCQVYKVKREVFHRVVWPRGDGTLLRRYARIRESGVDRTGRPARVRMSRCEKPLES